MAGRPRRRRNPRVERARQAILEMQERGIVTPMSESMSRDEFDAYFATVKVRLDELGLLPRPRRWAGSRPCGATTSAGRHCRSFATLGTEPPRCLAHGGRRIGRDA